MQLFDASQRSLADHLLMCSLSACTNTSFRLKSLCTDPFLETFAHAIGVTLTRNNTHLLLTPSTITRTIELHVPEPLTVSDVIDALTPLFLFSGGLYTATLHGITHHPNKPTICWYSEVYFRMLKRYVESYRIGVPRASLTEGTVELSLRSKATLTKVIGSLRLQEQTRLSHITVELISKHHLESFEQLSLLTLQRLHTPVVVNTRVADFSSCTFTGYFGTEEGYDNDRPFMQSYTAVQETLFTQQELLAHLARFQETLTQTTLSESLHERLQIVIALAGGALPATTTTPSWVASFLGIPLLLNPIRSEGYASVHSPEIMDIDDL